MSSVGYVVRFDSGEYYVSHSDVKDNASGYTFTTDVSVYGDCNNVTMIDSLSNANAVAQWLAINSGVGTVVVKVERSTAIVEETGRFDALPKEVIDEAVAEEDNGN